MSAGLLTQLKSVRPGLGEAEGRVADWILAHPDDVPQVSVQALARSAGASVATVIRLAQHVGCTGYADLKIRLARQSEPAISAMYEAVADGDPPAQLVSKVFGGNSRSLDETLKMLDPAEMDRAARRVARCRRCFVYGFGSSAYVAQDTALRLAHLGVEAVACPGVLETAISAMQVSPKDVAIGISHSGRSVTTVDSLVAAGGRGALTIGVSNYLNSPLHQASDIFFCLAFPESKARAAALSSRVSQVCLIDALYLLIARHVRGPVSTEAVDAMVEDRFRMPARSGRRRTESE